ncbi:MAG: hypothetical protein IJ626_02810 [Muribaculaceae bacterium]|nr:hypothetical protein [Muribaculaceae bacterium]
MKYHGCILSFTEERNNELMKAFRQAIHDSQYIDITRISQMVVNTPCSRFWVSEERALVVIVALLKGIPVLNTMRPTKREMFREIFSRVITLRQQQPSMPLAELISIVVNSPAPQFYMTPRSAMETIYKIKKQRHSTHSPL